MPYIHIRWTDQSKAKETEILPVLHFPLNKQSKCKAHCYGGLFTFLVMVMMMHFREEIPGFFPFTCWQITYFILPSSKKRTATFIKYFIWVMYYCQSRDLVVSSTFIHVKPWHLRFAGFHRFHSSYPIPTVFLPSLPQSFHVSSSQSRSNKIVTKVQVVHIFCGNYWWWLADCAFCRLHKFQWAYD